MVKYSGEACSLHQTQSLCAAESSGRCDCIWPATVQAHKESQLLLISKCALCNCLLFRDWWQPGRIRGFPFPWLLVIIIRLLERTKPSFMVLKPVVLDLPCLKPEKKKINYARSSGSSLPNIAIGEKLMWVIHRNLSCWILGMWGG